MRVSENRLQDLALPGAILFAILGVVYLLSKSVFNGAPEIDLKYVWVAGQLWADGINPYSDQFGVLGDQNFSATNTLDHWLYPPNWWVLSRGLAAFEIERATWMWRTFNAMLLVGGVLLAVLAFRDRLHGSLVILGALLFGYVATMQPTAQSLTMGQTSILLYFGLCAVIFGLMRDRSVWVVLGLVLVALKPQAGLVVYAAIVALPQQRARVLSAVCVTGLLCVPAFVSAGFLPTVIGVVEAYLSYNGALEVTSAANTTGVRHLIYAGFGIDVPSLVLVLLASVLVFALTRALDGRETPVHFQVSVLILLAQISLVPLHSYDFMVAAPLGLLAFMPDIRWVFRGLVAVCLLLIYRADNLGKVTGITHPETLYSPGTLIYSAAAVLLAAGLLTTLGRLSRDA